MNKKIIITLFVLCSLICVDGKKSMRRGSSGSGRGSSRKTNSNPQPAPTSFGVPQSTAAKPSLFGWQEKPAQKSASTWQSKTQSGQSHSYPSSQTGLSGTKSNSPQTNQESVQRSHVPQTQSRPATQGNSQSGHSYPSSNGLSGNSAAGYPQGTGLSGSGAGRPASPGAGYPPGSSLSGSGAANPVSSGAGYPQGGGLSGSGSHVANPGASYPHGAPPPYPGNKPYNNANSPQSYGNNYQHPPPPPPYPNQGSNYGGYGGHGGYGGYGGHGYNNPGPQTPGYFGNVANYGKGYGGVSRTSSALKGVGIAGAGVGTLLTGLALWNLARSTGHHHHTVIYDNKGQPVAVAPANDTAPPADSFLNDLVNCSLTISTDNSTEVLAIPCAIASSFSPDADVKDVGGADGKSDNTKCIVTVITKTAKEYTTTIPCATLLNTAAENNVTEPPLIANGTENFNATIGPGTAENMPVSDQPAALGLSSGNLELIPTNSTSNCTSFEPGELRDPINPCLSVTSDLTVVPLQTTDIPK